VTAFADGKTVVRIVLLSSECDRVLLVHAWTVCMYAQLKARVRLHGERVVVTGS
jgi:hypothetical protein